MKIFSAPVVLMLLVINSGCMPAHESANDSVNDSHYPPEIRYFSVISAPGATAYSYGAAPITPYLDSGNFLIQWEVAAESAYQIDLYVSNDPRLGPQDPLGREDVHFKQLYHGIGGHIDHEFYLDTMTMNCQFSVDNFLSCGRISYENPGRDITPFLTQLPKIGYIILRACDETMHECTTAALRVEFQ